MNGEKNKPGPFKSEKGSHQQTRRKRGLNTIHHPGFRNDEIIIKVPIRVMGLKKRILHVF